MSADIIDLSFGQPASRDVAAPSAPAITVREDDDSYTISTDLPGVATDDVAIGLSDGVLTIAATVDCESGDHIGPMFAVNHLRAQIEQSFALPDDADPETLSAVFDDTILRICIGRKFEMFQ